MFTLVSLGILIAAIVGGFNYGVSTDTLMIAAALFAVAGSITTAALTIKETLINKK